MEAAPSAVGCFLAVGPDFDFKEAHGSQQTPRSGELGQRHDIPASLAMFGQATVKGGVAWTQLDADHVIGEGQWLAEVNLVTFLYVAREQETHQGIRDGETSNMNVLNRHLTLAGAGIQPAGC